MCYISVKKVSFNFDHHFAVLHNVSFEVPKGTITSIVGPSGCGKTILLWLMAGFIEPSKGQILVNSRKVSSPDPTRMMIFQDYALFPWLHALGNVEAALEGKKYTKIAKERIVFEALEMVGLQEFAEWPVFKLSGGMQQRICLARALATNAKIWLLDEPFSALDKHNRENMYKLVKNLQKKTNSTILIVTHSTTEAIRFSDHVLAMTARPSRVKRSFDTRQVNNPNTLAFRKIKNEIIQTLQKEFKKKYLEEKKGKFFNFEEIRKDLL